MKKLKRWLSELFAPETYNDLNVGLITEAFNDPAVRSLWLEACFDQIKLLNVELDRRLLSGKPLDITDLCAKRRAYQEILEAIISARRKAGQHSLPQHGPSHNPQGKMLVDLDRVTG